MSRSRFRWWLLTLFLLAFLLRAWNLGGKSFWLDEAFSFWNADRTLTLVWNGVFDNHPPAYYLMLKYWKAFNTHESWLRLPSVLVSMLSLALTAVLSRRLFDRRTAVTAVALLTVAPLTIWYAQEARMVIFVVPFALLIALGLADNSRWGGLMIFVGLAGGLYFDYTIIPLWVIVSGLWLQNWHQKGLGKRPFIIWFVSSLAGWLAFMPLWFHLGLVAGRLNSIFVIANIREQFNLPDLGGLLFILGVVGLGGVAVISGWLWWKMVKRPKICQILTVAVLAGFIILTLLAPIPRLYSIKRLVVTGWPLIIILVAMLLSWLRAGYQWVRTAIFAISLATACVSLWLVPKDDWRGVVDYVNQNSGATDVIWMATGAGRLPYNFYEPKLEPMAGLNLLDEAPSVEIWHIAERQPGLPVPNGVIELWLDENRPLLEVVPFYRLEVRRYGKE